MALLVLLSLECLHTAMLILVVVGRLKETYWLADICTRFCAIRVWGGGGIAPCSLAISIHKHQNVIFLLIFCCCSGNNNVFLLVCMVTMAVKIGKYWGRHSGYDSPSFYESHE